MATTNEERPPQRPRRRRDVEDDDAGAEGPSEYEFSAQDDAVFRRLALAMTVVGLLEVGGAVLFVALYALTVGALSPGAAAVAVPPLAALLVGVWTYQAGRRFGLVASTKGADVSHLMEAVRGLSRLYLLQVAALAVGLVGLVASSFLG